MHLAVAENQPAVSLVAVETLFVVAGNLAVGILVAVAGILAVVGSQSESLAVVAVVPQAVAVELLIGDNYPGHLADTFVADHLAEEIVAENQPAESLVLEILVAGKLVADTPSAEESGMDMVTADTAGVLAVVAVVGLELGQKFESAVLHGSAPVLAAVWLKVLDGVVAVVVVVVKIAGVETAHCLRWRSESEVQTVVLNSLSPQTEQMKYH